METIPLKRAVIKEELVALTGDGIKALILNQFLYWSKIKHFSDKFTDEELGKLKKGSSNSLEAEQYENTRKNLSKGWIYKKSSEMADEIMLGVGEKTISRHIEELIKQGFLLRRHNPFIKYDRTYQYRIDFDFLKNKLNELGYSLEGYRTKNIVEPAETLKSQNDVSNMTNEDISKSQNDFCKSQNDFCKSQNVGAIPEITTEITTEITSLNGFNGMEEKPHDFSQDFTPEGRYYKDCTYKMLKLLKQKSGKHFDASNTAINMTRDIIDEGYDINDIFDVVIKQCNKYCGTSSEKFQICPTSILKLENFEKHKTDTKSLIPSREEVYMYCTKDGIDIDVTKFYTYYQDRDWEINGEKIKDWKSLIVNVWAKNKISKPKHKKGDFEGISYDLDQYEKDTAGANDDDYEDYLNSAFDMFKK
jgi:hypothetical protein